MKIAAAEQIRVFKALSRENTVKILSSIIEHNTRSPSQLAVELDLQPTQVHRALGELVETGLVQRHAKNPTPLRSWVFYKPTPLGKQAMRLLTSER